MDIANSFNNGYELNPCSKWTEAGHDEINSGFSKVSYEMTESILHNEGSST